MRKYYILTILLCCYYVAVAQVTFSYDTAGSRIKRQANPCTYDISLGSTTTTPKLGELVSLTANCTGPDCPGMTYTWSGLGLSGSGPNTQKDFYAPGTTGTRNYIVSSSKAGCNVQKDTIALSVIAGGTYVLTDGCYTIGTFGTLVQPTSNSANSYVLVATPSGSNDQKYKFEGIDTDSYKIISVSSGLVLNPYNNVVVNTNKNVIQTWTNSTYQKWYVSRWSGAGGGYQIANKSNPSTSLQYQGGGNTAGVTALDYSTNIGGGHQRFDITAVTCPPGVRIAAEEKQPVAGSEIKEGLILFPNPVEDRLRITLDSPAVIKKVEIFNSSGQSVLSTTELPSEGIDVANLQPGLHVVKVTTDDGSIVVHKIIKK